MWNRDEQDSQFSQMIEARLSRRRFLAGTAAVGAGAFLSLNPITKAFAADKKSALLLSLITHLTLPTNDQV